MDNVTQNDIMASLTNEQLLTFKAQNRGNVKVEEYIDAILANRAKEAEAVKVKEAFEAKVLTLANLPKPPDTIHNIFMRWAEVNNTEVEPEMITVTGKTEPEARYPKVWKWIVETNHADKIGKVSGESTVSVSKRAITVYKRDGTSLTVAGNFPSGSKACEHLHIDQASGSANLALRNAGYIVEAYTGTNFTVK